MNRLDPMGPVGSSDLRGWVLSLGSASARTMTYLALWGCPAVKFL
jgi:hypothetical protein